MNTTHTRRADTLEPAVDLKNRQIAQERIDRAVADTPMGRPIPTDIARLIAATIHRGPTTALGTFAATGALDAARALGELSNCYLHELPPDWWLALDLYLQKEAGDGRA